MNKCSIAFFVIPLLTPAPLTPAQEKEYPLQAGDRPSLQQKEPLEVLTYEFELDKKTVMRILAVEEGVKVEVYSVYLRLRKTRVDRGEFELEATTGSRTDRKNLKTDEPLTFSIPLLQPYFILITGVEKDAVKGYLRLQKNNLAIAEISLRFYEYNGKFYDRENYVRLRMPGASPPTPATLLSSVSTAQHRVENPKPIRQTTLRYSDWAIEAGIKGTVLLQGVVRKDGSVRQFVVLRSLGYGLDELAIEEIGNNWRFEPGTLDGEPVDALATIEVRFDLATFQGPLGSLPLRLRFQVPGLIP